MIQFKLFPSVVAFIVVLASHQACALFCSELLKNTLYVSSTKVKSHRQVPLVERITQDNMRSVFRHNYSGKHWIFGAKAIVLMLPGKTPEVYFFATGKKNVPWHMNHLGALKVVLQENHQIDIGNGPSWDPSIFNIVEYAQGYQFTAEKKREGLKITIFETQSQLLDMRQLVVADDLAFDAIARPLILERIDPSLLAILPNTSDKGLESQ